MLDTKGKGADAAIFSMGQYARDHVAGLVNGSKKTNFSKNLTLLILLRQSADQIDFTLVLA